MMGRVALERGWVPECRAEIKYDVLELRDTNLESTTFYINSSNLMNRTRFWLVRGTMNLESEGVVVSGHNFFSPALFHPPPR